MLLTLGTTPAVQKTMTFDRVTLNDVNRAKSVEQTASGKSINLSRVLRTLGEDVKATGFLGGESGRFIRAQLDEAGIRHDFVEVGPATRTCVTMVDAYHRAATELIEEPQKVGPASYERLTRKLQELLPGAAALVMCGSLPPDAPADFYKKATLVAGVEGVRVILDAKGEPLKLALAAEPFVVKPNRTELGETVGVGIESDAALKNAIRKLIDAGPKWAVVTMGGEGAIVSDGGRFWRVGIPRITVVNPIGSGDSFAAGLAAAVSRGRDVPDACRLAAACGCANAMTPVAGMVRLADVAMIEPQVTLEKW